jgi:tetratricopeptide (TPR) repeat protein
MAEKNINQISADARRLHTKAVEAAQRDNLDYAITLYVQVLEKEPGFFECRRALREQQFKKAAASGGGFFKKMMSGAGSSPLLAKAKMALGKNPAEAMATAEQILINDFTNASAHRIIVDAAKALEMPNTAVLELETMARNSPKDKAVVVEFAEMVAETGTASATAEKLLNDLIRGSGYDQELLQAQKNLSAHKTMKEGGYGALEGGGGSFRDVLRNKEEAVSLEQEKRVHKSEDTTGRLINEYEERLPSEPNNLKLLRSLAELYTQKNQFDRALELYGRIKSSEMGSDANLDRAIMETTVRQFDSQIKQLDPTAPDHEEHVARITAEKLNYQMAECQKRVEKYPTDMGIRFEMGVLYFQAGKIGEATAEFQKAQSNPHKRISAMNYLAQCFSKRKMYDMAARKFQEAIKEKPGVDEEKKDLIYNLGCVLESMGKKEEAIEQFKIIYEMDVGYRDVGAKVDAFYSGQ